MNFYFNAIFYFIILALIYINHGTSLRSSKKSIIRLLQNSNNYPAYNISLENFGNQGYDTQIFIGSLEAAFYMQFDTSTPWIWIPDITVDNEDFPNRYNCSQSQTCTIFDTESIVLEYPQGTIQGFQASDYISFPSGFTLSQNSLTYNATFIEALSIDPIFDNICVGDGLIGLGLSSSTSIPNMIDILYNQSLISSRWFSLYLTNDQDYYDDYSILMIGGYNKQYLQSNQFFTYVPVANNSIWSIHIDNYSIGSLNNTLKPKIPGTIGILASTNTNIGVNPDDMDEIWKIITKNYNNTCSFNQTIGYFCHCEAGDLQSFPNFTIRSGDITLEIPASQYIYHNNSGYYSDYLPNATIHYQNAYSAISGDLCIVLLQATNSTFNYSDNYQGQWFLGIPILESYYTVYNMDNMSIGFALSYQLIFDDDSELQLWILIAFLILSFAMILGIVFIMTDKHKKNKAFHKMLLQQQKESFYSNMSAKKTSDEVFLYNPRNNQPLKSSVIL